MSNKPSSKHCLVAGQNEAGQITPSVCLTTWQVVGCGSSRLPALRPAERYRGRFRARASPKIARHRFITGNHPQLEDGHRLRPLRLGGSKENCSPRFFSTLLFHFLLVRLWEKEEKRSLPRVCGGRKTACRSVKLDDRGVLYFLPHQGGDSAAGWRCKAFQFVAVVWFKRRVDLAGRQRCLSLSLSYSLLSYFWLRTASTGAAGVVVLLLGHVLHSLMLLLWLLLSPRLPATMAMRHSCPCCSHCLR